jgi:hypothetical protein
MIFKNEKNYAKIVLDLSMQGRFGHYPKTWKNFEIVHATPWAISGKVWRVAASSVIDKKTHH